MPLAAPPRFRRLSAAAAVVAIVALPVLPHAARAQALAVNADDTIEKLLVAQKGKRVTIKLGPSDELTGTVKAVTPNLVHLSELAGREFFDAAIDLKQVRAVIVRTRN